MIGDKVPELIVYVGRCGSGKSTHYKKYFLGTHTYVNQDEQGGKYKEIFEKAVANKENIVVDRQNHLREQRTYFLEAAKRNGYKTRVIEFKVPKDLCERRILNRKDHPTISNTDNVRVILNQYERSYQGVLQSECDLYEEIKERFYAPIQDLTHLKGRIAVVGDVHGAFKETKDALDQIKPDHIVYVGDVVDRGPDILPALKSAQENYTVLGNHEQKFARWLKGNKVSMGGGLEATANQISSYTEAQREDLYNWLQALPLIIKLPKNYIVVHAGLNPSRPLEKQHYDTCLYIRNHGGKKFDDKNFPKWYEFDLCDDLKKYKILFGHAIHEKCEVAKNVYSLDKGAVYGTGLRIMVIDTEGNDEVKEYPTKIYYESNTEPDRNKFFKFEQLVQQGFLSKSEQDDLVLYNYTDACTFNRNWVPETLESRGTIYSKTTGELVARAFPKFFNLNEDETTRLENLPFHLGFTAFEKMDGSMGTLYRHKGEYKIATRGSFYSDQAKRATEMLKKYNLTGLSDEVTLLFEIIYPENQIILPYGNREELVLLAAFNYKIGYELPWDEVLDLAQTHGFSTPKVYPQSFEELLKLKDEIAWNESEGWVLLFNNGLRIKVKGADYLRIAKVKSYMTPLAFWEAMMANKAEEYLVSIPEELRAEAETIYGKLKNQLDVLKQKAEVEVQKLNLNGFNTKDKQATKQMALEVFKRSSWMRGYLFAVMHGKGSNKHFLKLIRPTENVYANLDEFE